VRTGDWSTDNRTGRHYAKNVVRFVCAGPRPTILGLMVKAMIEKGEFGGVEVGFFQEIAEMLMRVGGGA
jgi:hypothetical protein